MGMGWLAFSLFISLLFFFFSLRRRREENLPPGPRGWPIVGNIFQLGSKPHAALASLARTHGPLISLRLGTQRVVVASSPSAASLVLKTHDHSLSYRALPQGGKFPEYANHSLVWADCTDSWKQLRTICRTQLFSRKMVDDGANLRQQKVEEMVGRLRSTEGKATNVAEVVFDTIFDMLASCIFSEDAEAALGSVTKMKGLTRKLIGFVTKPNVSDYFPVVAGIDIQGIRRKSRAYTLQVYEVWEGILAKRKEQRGDGAVMVKDNDFLDVLLSSGFSDLQIKAVLLDMFFAGTDTTTTTVEWAMAALVKQPEVMTKLRRELSDALCCTSRADSTMYEKLRDLRYLQACIKESMRLYPPVPLLLPHRASETCPVLGYTIPKGCQVLVNLWAIGRDPTTWDDPLAFRPERFSDSPNLDFKGADYELIPFGSGRRMCAGLPLAVRTLELILAALVHNFEWSLPYSADLGQLGMEEKFGLTLQREQPLQLIPKFIEHK
ncbi:probable (S)-N-methylcoclaurine 3'-hydroxylase isozyme 2 [Nymphaea colorata]|nr:probable (S)-N-methylcoclaurine 3'-hydroxylase isozyme 2 [Nymphaea colorata]